MNRSFLALCSLAIGFSTISGCGKSVGGISGTVTFKGKTVASGTVIVVGSDGIPYYGKIATDGSYSVSGVPTGIAKIAVNSPNPTPDPDKVAAAKAGAKRGGREQQDPITAGPTSDPKLWFAIPSKYADPNTSGKEVTIKGNDKFNIELD